MLKKKKKTSYDSIKANVIFKVCISKFVLLKFTLFEKHFNMVSFVNDTLHEL